MHHDELNILMERDKDGHPVSFRATKNGELIAQGRSAGDLVHLLSDFFGVQFKIVE